MTPDVRNNIKHHIDCSGYYAITVNGGPTPRWSYTIGLSETRGYELLFAGGIDYMLDQVLALFDKYAAIGKEPPSFESGTDVAGRPVHETWADRLMVGVAGYYGAPRPSVQIVPTRPTIDTPDTSLPYATSSAGPFRWLDEPWAYPVPAKAEAMTNLRALFGEPVTEAARWEERYWELFAGPGDEVTDETARAVPIGTLLSHDSSLEPILRLGIGDASRREPGKKWRAWKKKG